MKLLCITLFSLNILFVIVQGTFTALPVQLSHLSPSSSVTPPSNVVPTASPLTIICYRVLDTKNRTCVNVCLDAFNITTNFVSTNRILIVTTKPSRTIGTVKVTGSCSSPNPNGTYNESHIELSWDSFTLTLNFSSNIKKISSRNVNSDINQWYLSSVTFKNGTYVYKNNSATIVTIGATIGQSYKCDKTFLFHMVHTTLATNVTTFSTLSLTNYTIQPFASPEEPFKFINTINCVADDNNLLAYIPIIVGCALAGLVLLVLVANVIGTCSKRKLMIFIDKLNCT